MKNINILDPNTIDMDSTITPIAKIATIATVVAGVIVGAFIKLKLDAKKDVIEDSIVD